MSGKKSGQPSRQQLLAEIEALRARLAEAEDTVRAIHEGDVDAIVVSGSRGEQVFSLTGSEYVYRQIVETMKEAALMVSLEGRILFCNDQFRRLIKESPARIVGRPLTDFVTADQKEAAGAVLRKSRRRPVKQRLVFQDTGGVPVPAHISSHVLHQPDGASICIVATDLTELEASAEMLRQLRYQQEALRASEGRYKSLAENLPSILMRYNRDLRVVYLSPMAEGVTGIPAEKFIGRTNREVGMPADLCDLWEQAIAEVFRTGRNRDLEFDFPSAGGPRSFYLKLAPEFDAGGAVDSVLGISTEITERNRAEWALHAAHGRITSILETMSDCFATFDRDWRYTYVNAAAAKAFHMTPEQLLGKTLWELWPAAYDLPLGANFRRALQEDIPLQFEQFYPEPLNRWFECRCHPTPEGVATFFSDITERKQAEEALRRAHESLQAQSEELAAANEELRTQSEELAAANEELKIQSEELEVQSVQLHESGQRLRLALEAGGMGHWEWDLQKDTMSWCQRSRELLDLNLSAPPTRESFLRRVHPDDREAMKKLTARTLLESADFQVDFRVLHNWQDARGEIVWLASRGRVIRDEQGRGVRMIGVLYDITQRKQMEEQLRRMNDHLEEEIQAQTEALRHTIDRLQDEVVRRVLAEGKLRRRSQMLEGFFQHTIGPLAFLDRQFNFVRVNEAYARAEGRDAQSLIGQSYFALHPDAEDQMVFLHVVRSKQPYRACARPFHYPGDPRGVTYWDWQLTPLLDERGQVQFLVFNLEDVTRRQKAFQELEQRAHQLQKLTLELAQAEDRERRRLAEILHDDLQQQLAAAKFHLGILSGRVRNDETAQELAGQVNHLLKEAIAKSRNLSHELSPAVLYQSDLGETFEWLARQMEAKHGLKVHVEVRGQVSSQADALKAFLYRSAQELLFNVIKHARVKEARLRLQRVRGRLWLTVSDQGPGFETPALGRASGFGLLGIRERVELLGGRMKIRSAKGRGSTFLIVVPELTAPARADVPAVLPETQAPAGRTKSAVATPPEQRLHVLLVDDHEVMREGLAALLAEQTDIEVVGQAGNGREAVDLAHRLRPEVVIMDVAMPVMAGDEATRQIKLHLPGIQVIALSMFDEPEMAERMRQAGAAAYLLKTGPSEDLLAAIRGRPKP